MIFIKFASVGTKAFEIFISLSIFWVYAGNVADIITRTTASTIYLGTALENCAFDLNTKFFCTKKFTVWASVVAIKKLKKPASPRFCSILSP